MSGGCNLPGGKKKQEITIKGAEFCAFDFETMCHCFKVRV